MESFEDVDLRWQPEPLWDEWPRGHDTDFMLWRMEDAFLQEATAGPPGRMLDAACGHARHAPEMHRRGWQLAGVEPSREMITRAKEVVAEEGGAIDLFCGIGETMPFRDATFDRVVCQSSLDHYADPATGMREMSRILRPGGTIVIGVNNYHGLSCRTSRLIYAAKRALRLVPRGKRLFWDNPTHGEHTFEGSLPALKRFAGPELQVERVRGVSMLWALPGWNRVLSILPDKLRRIVLGELDRLARIIPGASDFIIVTWRKR
jgi:SAM-dependent methyltransferase